MWQRFIDPARFVFLDETGIATNMTWRYGRSPSGARLVAAVPHGHWRTTTFVAGLRQTGIVAPLVLDGPMTGTAFCAWVEQFLAPALAPGDVVVLDNQAAHKVTASAMITCRSLSRPSLLCPRFLGGAKVRPRHSWLAAPSSPHSNQAVVAS